MKPEWDFDYVPLHAYPTEEGVRGDDFVVATENDVDSAVLVAALADLAERVAVTPLLATHPLYWYRVQLDRRVEGRTVEVLVQRAGVDVRYVTSSVVGSQQVTRPADFTRAQPRRARDWRVREAGIFPVPSSEGSWFLGPSGVNVNRAICGTGAGMRLAVIDNDVREIDQLDLDARVLVGTETIPTSSVHGALAVGWAVGSKVRPSGRRFAGVAPDASTRIYCVPKPGAEIFTVPIAIVRAVDDGADVVLCATYLDGAMSPLFDDAFEFARRLGRYGRGTAVVLPSSREMSSAGSSLHASLSLGPAEPASDPRVFCVGPSSRDGGWFLWRDRRGKLHPFANRGPALRWLAPGDDMPYPFSDVERPTHAESSGAAAVAAGVLLLVLGQNPELTVDELGEVVTKTASPINPALNAACPDLADKRDLLPIGADADRHNAKHGYGRMNATAACAVAQDPIAATLIGMGEGFAAETWLTSCPRPYNTSFARRAARVVLRDAAARHALAVLARTLRLWAHRPERSENRAIGALTRHVVAALRLLVGSERLERGVNEEAERLLKLCCAQDPELFERKLLEAATRLIRLQDEWSEFSSELAERRSVPPLSA